MSLVGKKILVGITGGIAAYKICELVRSLIKGGAEVKVVLTPSAKEFVTETTLSTLSRNPVYCGQYSIEDWKPDHISLADEADIFVIAPASANTIGKIANGICDNLLTSLVAAFKKPVLLAPAMNCNMWENQFVQENLQKLRNSGFFIIDPAKGELACGYEGIGRMAEVKEIFEKTEEILGQKSFLKGKKFLVTAGGTKEELNPVRFLGNYSSGKMGIALADAAYQAGGDVVLVSTVEVSKPYKVLKVKSALEMLECVEKEFSGADFLVMAAAVADYRPLKKEENKIKKEVQGSLTLELVKNPDILKEIAKIKKHEQVLVGFAAETENVYENALKKLEEKHLDFVVANGVSEKQTGFNSDLNKVIIINKNKDSLETGVLTKKEIAKMILKEITQPSLSQSKL